MTKKVIKVRSVSMSILPLLVALIGLNKAESHDKKLLLKDCHNAANYISDRFPRFVKEYNKSLKGNESKWMATKIELKKDVIDITDNSKAVYLDFDGNHGYMVIGDNFRFLDFKSVGDLPYLKNVDELYFSEYDGFVYKTDFGYARYDFTYPTEKDLHGSEIQRFYEGQVRSNGEGSGIILDPDAYIKDRYGSDYRCETTKLLPFDLVCQSNYGIYYGKKGEGNCTLSAMYGIMRYLRDHKGMDRLPNGSTEINPKDDFFYDEVTKNGWKAVNEKVSVPTIYAKIRQAAIKFGYRTEGTLWSSINMVGVYLNALNSMGYKKGFFTTYASMVLIWSFDSQVKKEIDAGFPTMWNTLRGQFGSHSMIVYGYKSYFKERKFWFFQWKEYKHLMALNDNWSGDETTYFDLDAYGKNLLWEGFGTFVKVRNYQFF